MSAEYDFSELEEFERNISNLARNLPSETKKFLKKEATALKNLTKKEARSKVKRRTGNYLKGIKAGKVYTYRANGSLAVRVYAGSPAYHAHLLEYGKTNRDGSKTEGKEVFETSAKKFENTFFSDTEKFINDNLRGI